ncbi:MAG: SGNH/GDSL hydrolase family protein [Burkholderiaceae bacterium]
MNPYIVRFARPWLRATAVAAAAILVASCGGGDETPAPPALFSTTVAFGASLTDTGNVCPTPATPGCPPVPPYAQGRFSNGALWGETIAAQFGGSLVPSTQGGTNFAYAGARTGAIPGLSTQSTTPSMAAQVDQYLTRVNFRAEPRFLYLVDASTFGNNITAGLPLIQAGTITSTQLVTAGITDVVTLVSRLYAAGARHILVANAPDVGATPLAQSLGAAAAAGATQLAAGFNQNLAAQLTGLQAVSPGLTIYLLDLFALSVQVTQSPAQFGLSNVTQPCVVTSPTFSVCTQPDLYLYWDGFHPTRAAGALIAQRGIALLPTP